MPGLKRQRVPNRNGDDSDDSTESNKRLRLSLDVDSDEESSSSLDDETEKLYATQVQQQQHDRRNEKNEAAENGIIESIECHNFMCHTYLHVDVGPLINFIIGHNGSGKSAVLTALTISLGGKASATNRAGSLKSFIKEGEDTCTLKVRIKNGGETGYQPDLYGNVITVERSFNRAGTSGFKLRGANDRIVSTRKADLEEISDYYALQLDNPISVLTQDQARQFLSGASSNDKYKFFVKGVQLEQLYHDYELLAESIAQTEATFHDKLEQVASLLARREKAKELLDLVTRQQEVRKRLNELGMQMAWSQVEEQERRLTQIDDDLKKVDNEFSVAQTKANETSVVYDEAVSKKSQADDASKQYKDEERLVASEKADVRTKSDELKQEGHDMQEDQRKIKQQVRACNDSIEKTKASIAEENRRLEELHGGSHSRRVARLDELKSAARAAKIKHEQHGKETPMLEASKTQAQSKLKEQTASRASKAQLVQESENRLRRLRESREQRGAYPNGMDQLLGAIQRERSFRDKPVGPIGDFVHLKKAVWSGILEKSFGAALNGFIVTSKDDQRLLSNLMRRSNCSVPVFIGNNSDFDFTGHEPDSQYETILRVLKIDHPLVLRQLVVNNNIEQIILIEDMDEARDTMMASRLPKVKACFSIQPGNHGLGERFAYGADNSVSTNYMDTHRGLPRMKTDSQNQINLESDVLDCVRSELNEHDAKHRELKQDFDACMQAINQHKKSSEKIKLAWQHAEDEADSFQDELEKNASEEGRLEQLKQGLETEEERKRQCESDYQESVLAKDEHLAKKKLLLVEMNKIDERVAVATRKLQKSQKTLEKAEDGRIDALVKKNQAFQAIEALRQTRTEQEEDRIAQSEKVEDFTVKAKRIGPRVAVDSGETTDSLERKLTKLDADQRRFEARIGGDTQKISDDYRAAVNAHIAAAKQIEDDEKLVQLFKQTYHQRKFRWEQFKKYITARARITFAHFLSERSFHGRLNINHRDKQLDIIVQPDETQRDRQGRQTKTLSGGEKSFSQICLLLSLWEAIGAPIRCLDEFDVFMDSVNREASMKLLIKAARDSVGRQFMLITPQSMASIDATHDIKIIKMRDPERNQGTLRFGS